jgi:hypothetical protein
MPDEVGREKDIQLWPSRIVHLYMQSRYKAYHRCSTRQRSDHKNLQFPERTRHEVLAMISEAHSLVREPFRREQASSCPLRRKGTTSLVQTSRKAGVPTKKNCTKERSKRKTSSGRQRKKGNLACRHHTSLSWPSFRRGSFERMSNMV